MKVMMINYEENKIIDITQLFDEELSEKVFNTVNSLKIVDNVLEITSAHDEILYYEPAFEGEKFKVLLPGGAAVIETDDGETSIKVLSKHAISLIDKGIVTEYLVTKGIDRAASERISLVISEYNKLTEKPKEELFNELLQTISTE